MSSTEEMLNLGYEAPLRALSMINILFGDSWLWFVLQNQISNMTAFKMKCKNKAAHRSVWVIDYIHSEKSPPQSSSDPEGQDLGKDFSVRAVGIERGL